MATPSEIRRLAFQMLFQMDASAVSGFEGDPDSVAEMAREAGLEFTDRDVRRARALCEAAFMNTQEADEVLTELSPSWPPRRQPAADRTALRLAHYELIQGKTPPRVVISEAVELAKVFGTEKSPGFVNGVLDSLKRRLSASGLPSGTADEE